MNANKSVDLPIPPGDLIYRVAGSHDPDWFQLSGELSMDDIRKALSLVKRSLDEFTSMLDFGCGCGREFIWLARELPPGEIHGVDIDREAISWLRSQLPDHDIRVSNPLPPLDFNDASFDIVHSHSVFTHLNEAYQEAWLEELLRVTKPGAILLFSTHGEHAFQELEQLWIREGADPAPIREHFNRHGSLFVPDDEWKNGPFPDFYHSMFQTAWQVRRQWGEYFKVLEHIPRGSLDYQDIFVLEHPRFGGRAAMMETDASDSHSPRETGIPAPPMPPLQMRQRVGTAEEIHYDNPTGDLTFPEIPSRLYERVFDFGCGCGRNARQLLQQKCRPAQYVGIDIDLDLIEWCQANFSPLDSGFRFLHHDLPPRVEGKTGIPEPTAPFPAEDAEFSLVNAHSVFTHLLPSQAEHYLREVARVLSDDGIARTTWFFFDRESVPWLPEHQVCLYTSAEDPTQAVIYDRGWFLDKVRDSGLSVRLTIPAMVPGHQWQLFLERRRPGQPDLFPQGEQASEWLCGATRRPLPRNFWRE